MNHSGRVHCVAPMPLVHPLGIQGPHHFLVRPGAKNPIIAQVLMLGGTFEANEFLLARCPFRATGLPQRGLTL